MIFPGSTSEDFNIQRYEARNKNWLRRNRKNYGLGNVCTFFSAPNLLSPHLFLPHNTQSQRKSDNRTADWAAGKREEIQGRNQVNFSEGARMPAPPVVSNVVASHCAA